MHVCVRVCYARTYAEMSIPLCPARTCMYAHVLCESHVYMCTGCIYMYVVRVCGVCLECVRVCVCVHVGAYRPL